MVTRDAHGRWSNRAQDRIGLVAYDPRWIDEFAAEQRRIRECVDAAIPLAIEHFGSTAIPGLPAKPVIDIMVGAAAGHWPAIVHALQSIGYVHWADDPDADREFLVKGMPPYGAHRTHHVHVCDVESTLWERLVFRDYLRAHAHDRRAYADLKQRLVTEHPEDREAYTRGKDGLVAEIMERARRWRRGD